MSPAAEWAVKRLRRSVTALKKRCAEGTAAVDEYRRLVAVGAPPEGDALERLNTAITRLYPAEREAAAALNGAIPHLREVADLDRFDACMGNYKATAAELQTFSQRMNQRIMQFQARIPYQSESDSARQLAQLAQDLFEGVGQRVAMLNECLEFGIVLAD